MPSPRLRIAMVGGVPSVLGGGGLELQITRTTDALRALGHDARPVHAFEAGDELDVVHAFNHSGDVVHALDHWRRTPAAFVLSPVLVVEPSKQWRTQVGRHVPIPTFPARSLRDLVRKADAVIGLTAWERDFMIAHGGIARERCVVVGNGVDPVAPATETPVLPEKFLVSLGSVSPRKRQADIAQSLAGGDQAYVVVGGYEGDEPETFRAAVAATGGAWLGEISDAAIVRTILKRASALVLLSEREGQSLAVLEALASGTPVVASDLPSHRELAAEFPGWVTIADGPDDVERAAGTVVASASTSRKFPEIPTWGDVATSLVSVYGAAMTRGARTGQQR